jgi:hypothetical protein
MGHNRAEPVSPPPRALREAGRYPRGFPELCSGGIPLAYDHRDPGQKPTA